MILTDIIQIYFCIGLILVGLDYKNVQTHSDYHFNKQLNSQSKDHHLFNIDVLNLIRELLPLTFVISWPLYIRLLLMGKLIK